MHVGVLSTAAGTAGRTLAVSVSYRNQPSGLLTGRQSRKAAATDQPQAPGQGLIFIARRDLPPPQNILSVRRERETPADLDGARSADLAFVVGYIR